MPRINLADIVRRFMLKSEECNYWPSPGLRVDDAGIWRDELTGHEAGLLFSDEFDVIREVQRAATPDNHDLTSPVLRFPCELRDLVQFFDRAGLLVEFNYVLENGEGNALLDWHEEEYRKPYNRYTLDALSNKKVLKKSTESDLILKALQDLSYSPKALPVGGGIKSGAKKAVWDAIGSQFTSRHAFDSRWKAMKNNGELADAKHAT